MAKETSLGLRAGTSHTNQFLVSQKSVNWKTLYDKDGNAILVDPDNPGNRVVTDLRGTTPRLLDCL